MQIEIIRIINKQFSCELDKKHNKKNHNWITVATFMALVKEMYIFRQTQTPNHKKNIQKKNKHEEWNVSNKTETTKFWSWKKTKKLVEEMNETKIKG